LWKFDATTNFELYRIQSRYKLKGSESCIVFIGCQQRIFNDEFHEDYDCHILCIVFINIPNSGCDIGNESFQVKLRSTILGTNRIYSWFLPWPMCWWCRLIIFLISYISTGLFLLQSMLIMHVVCPTFENQIRRFV
jgi:hypothetical protein